MPGGTGVAWHRATTDLPGMPRVPSSNPASATEIQSQPLTLDAITHSYGDALAVDQVTLEVRAGELVALLGLRGAANPPCCASSAGFINQTAGRVVIADRVVDSLPPNRREVGIVFQSYALFPPPHRGGKHRLRPRGAG